MMGSIAILKYYFLGALLLVPYFVVPSLSTDSNVTTEHKPYEVEIRSITFNTTPNVTFPNDGMPEGMILNETDALRDEPSRNRRSNKTHELEIPSITLNKTSNITLSNDGVLEGMILNETDALRSEPPRNPRSETKEVVDVGEVDEIKYIEEEQPNFKDPVMKHYSSNDLVAFYPSFSYEGFYPPNVWHQIPIEYFTQPDSNTTNISTVTALAIEEHKSAMSLCTDQVISVIEQVKQPFSDKKEMCWGSILNECSSSTLSPIDIVTEEAKLNKNLSDFFVRNFDHPYSAQLFLPEDGTDLLTLKFVTAETEDPPAVSGGIVGDTELYLDRILFRIGYHQDDGSEHMLDGSGNGMELQFYFAPRNISYWEALAQYKLMKPNDPRIGQNVHAFTILVNVAPENPEKELDDEDAYPPKFEILSLGAQKLWSSRNPRMWRGVNFGGALFSLADFMSKPLTEGSFTYYSYEGSMTHPPCLPHLIWTVFETPVWMKFAQWQRFKYVHSEFSDDQFLQGNYRDVSDIIIKANVETYQKLKDSNVEGFIDQYELERAVEDEDAWKRGEPALFTVSYEKYKTYYAQRVTKGIGRRRKNWSEYDYEELISEKDRGSKGAGIGILLALIIFLPAFL